MKEDGKKGKLPELFSVTILPGSVCLVNSLRTTLDASWPHTPYLANLRADTATFALGSQAPLATEIGNSGHLSSFRQKLFHYTTLCLS